MMHVATTTSSAWTPPLRSARTMEVQRLSGAEAREYLDQWILPDRPVILTDVMDTVPAMRKWTLSFFRSHRPTITKHVHGEAITLAEQVDRILTSSEENPAPYPFSFDIEREAPGLMPDLEPFVHFGHSDRTVHPLMPRFLLKGTIVHELFFGGLGSFYPWLHYDVLGMHTQITQIIGDKDFYLYDPGQTPLLYPSPNNPRISLINNVFDPDLERFPAFSEARPMVVRVHEGETLYFPSGWWHVTRMHGPCVTYGRAVVNSSNWNKMMRENLGNWRRTHPGSAVPAYTYGRLVGAAFLCSMH